MTTPDDEAMREFLALVTSRNPDGTFVDAFHRPLRFTFPSGYPAEITAMTFGPRVILTVDMGMVPDPRDVMPDVLDRLQKSYDTLVADIPVLEGEPLIAITLHVQGSRKRVPRMEDKVWLRSFLTPYTYDESPKLLEKWAIGFVIHDIR